MYMIENSIANGLMSLLRVNSSAPTAHPGAAGPENLFARFDSSVRRAIRKAEKCGLEIGISNSLEAVREYYSLHCKTRRHHGLPPQPFTFFLNIHRHVLSQNMGMIVSAKHQQRPVASAVFFHTGAEAIYKFGASDPAFQELRANNLVMWEAIQWCVRNGKKILDFGRTSLANEGLRRYKLGWAAEERRIDYYRFDFRTEPTAANAGGDPTRVSTAPACAR